MWRNTMTKRIFITGIGGFIGGHLCAYLNQKGYEVFGSYFRPTGDLSIAEKNTRALWNIDVRYRPHLQEALPEVRPDIVYHLAAQSYPMVSYKESEYTVETNVLGTLNLFECSLSLGLKGTHVLLALSTAAYGFISPEETPVTEAQPMRPAHVYGMSKTAQDLLETTYVNAHRMDIILSELLTLVLEGLPFPIEFFTQPSLVRPVDEPIYWCDLSKVQAHTGWIPEISLEKTVRDMIEWWKQHLQSKADGSLVSPSRES